MFGSGFLRLLQTLIYALLFCCSAITLGIYSYFLAVRSNHDMGIPKWQQAVTGMSGAGVLYTIFAVLLTCFLGGKPFFAFLAIVLDILFCGAFIAIAVMTRHGASSCSGFVRTPLGDAEGNLDAPGSGNFSYVCRLNQASFAVAIIGACLFFLATLFQLCLGRRHQKDKRFGPSPANNYTSGTGSSWWRRNRGPRKDYAQEPQYAAGGSVGGLTAPAVDDRASYETGYTASTAPGYEKYNAPAGNGYHTAPTTGGHHNGPIHEAPTGEVNPSGYDHEAQRTPATNY